MSRTATSAKSAGTIPRIMLTITNATGVRLTWLTQLVVSCGRQVACRHCEALFAWRRTQHGPPRGGAAEEFRAAQQDNRSDSSASCPHASRDTAARRAVAHETQSVRAPQHDAARPDCSARSRARTPSLLHPAAGANHCPLVLTDGREPRPVWVAAAPLRPVPFVYLCFAKGRYKETHTRGRALHRAPPPSA